LWPKRLFPLDTPTCDESNARTHRCQIGGLRQARKVEQALPIATRYQRGHEP
jgi:hypothetical protein